MRVFLGGVRTETNTFTARLTSEEDFRKGDVTPASEAYVDPGLHPGYAGFLLATHKAGWKVVRGTVSYAVPGGPVEEDVYRKLRDQLLAELEAGGPYDMVLLDLHGAMVAQETRDCEGDLLRRCRAMLGEDVIIGGLLDPHAVLSADMVMCADILHAYKEYPHTDVMERAVELFAICAEMTTRKSHVVAAVAECGLIGGFPTVDEPMRSFVDWMCKAEMGPGVVSVSLIQSFPWCDHQAAGAKFLVYANDRKTADALAGEGGRRFRDIFEAAVMKPLPAQGAARIVAAHPQKPYIIADISDNPGGGASGDATHLLRALIESNVKGIGAALFNDRETLERAWASGVGGVENFRIGGKLSLLSGAPIEIKGVVKALAKSDDHEGRGAVGGPSSGPLALIGTDFGDVVVCGERRQALSPALFTALGVDPHAYRVLVLKSSAHFRAAFSSFKHEILEAGSPAEMNPDLPSLPFTKIRRPLWPFDPLPPVTLWEA